MAAIIVTDSGDSGPGTLRDAIASANAGDTITFDPGLAGRTIELSSTLAITKPVTIDGTGADIALSGGNLVTDFSVDFTAAGTATLKGLTIADGNGTGTMGSAGSSGSSAAAAQGGLGGDAAGGVFVKAGSIDLSNDHFVDDAATGGAGGTGGSYAVSVMGFSIDFGGMGGTGGNAAGAVYVEPGVAVKDVSNLTYDGDSAAGGPGGDGGTVGFETGPVGTSGTAYQDVNPAVCFVSGTLIRTERGDVAVEDLKVGDHAVTSSGAHRPILWLGGRIIDCRDNPRRAVAQPVRISAHAFGDNCPARDLYLSPGHPVLVGADEDGEGGHLVPIMCLINGTTIERVAVDEVTYWHVELDRHDILLAEGLAAESYIDLGSRPWFDGAHGALYDPDMALPGMPGRCRPVAIDGPVVEAERRRLDAVFAMRLEAACAWPTAATDRLLWQGA